MPAPTVEVSEQDCSSDKPKDGSIPGSYKVTQIHWLFAIVTGSYKVRQIH